MLNGDVGDEVLCSEARERLGAWHDGELGEEAAAALAAHVASCPGCAREADLLRAVDAALLEVAAPPASVDLVVPLLAAVRRERRREGAWRWAAAAAVLLASGLGLLAGSVALRPARPSPPPVLAATLDLAAEAFAPGPAGGLGALAGEIEATAGGPR